MRMKTRLWGVGLGVVLFACGDEPGAPPPKSPKPPVAEPPPNTQITAPAPGKAPAAPVPLAEYFKILRVPALSRSDQPLLSFSADETKVAYVTNETGRPDIWVRPVTGEGTPVQITHSDGFVHSFAFSPKEDVLVFEADHGGDELPHLYATDSKGSAPRELVTDLPAGRRTQFVEFAKNGATFLYQSNARDEKYMDLLEYDMRSKKSTVLWQASGTLAFATVSQDHLRYALLDQHSDVNTDVWVLDRGQKTPTLLTQHTGDVSFYPAAFSKDTKSLFMLSDESGEYLSLYSAILPGGKHTKVSNESWDIDGAYVSNTGKYFVTVTNEAGTPKLVVTEKDKPVAIPAPPAKGAGWNFLAFSGSDRFVGLSIASDAVARTSYVADLKTGKLVSLVDPMPASLKNTPMVAGEAVEIPTNDGKKVPAFLYRPPGATGVVPAIIEVHGGPTAQSRRDFVGSRQYFLSKGYAYLVPNVRGSTGYGKSWTKLDNLDFGGGPLQDVVACKRWLVANAGVAAEKVVVAGGSYGGYMALAAEAFTPDEFVANVDFFGVSDLKSLVESFPAYWASGAAFIYQKFGDPKNPAHAKYQHDRSPLYFIDHMKKPLLVVQGDKDARVKKDQSDRIVQGLKQRGVPVHYLVLENEGHGFTKTENNLKAWALTDRFLDRYVWNDPSVTDLP